MFRIDSTCFLVEIPREIQSFKFFSEIQCDSRNDLYFGGYC